MIVSSHLKTMRHFTAIGLMSGTSLDGVDVAAITSDGFHISETYKGLTVPYSLALQKEIRGILGQTTTTSHVEEIANEITDAHIKAITLFLEKHSTLTPNLISFHGQTITHAPPFTWQIGFPQRIADHFDIPVIFDLRKNDLAHGGQGAPLVPIYHQALARNLPCPLAFINIGGIANITYVDKDVLIAGDTGPGMAMLNDVFQKKHPELSFDKDGELALKGTSHNSIIEKWLSLPYLEKPFPKSLDRMDFQSILDDISSLSFYDQLATLASFTAKSILKSIVTHFPIPPKQIILCGGGRHHKLIFQICNQYTPTFFIESIGHNGDFIEAEAWAFLGIRSVLELPFSYPTTTGVKQPLSGGILYPPQNSSNLKKSLNKTNINV